MKSDLEKHGVKAVDAMVVPVGQMPRKARLKADSSGSFLRDMQSRVGGPIEAIPGIFDGRPVVYVNEEDKLPWSKCLPNRAVYADDIQEPVDIVFGDMLCVGLDVEAGELRDISAEECQKVRERFGTKDSIESANREIMKMVERNSRKRAG
ncbi:DUF3846 domain-containing protein [Adlercreutzia sp. ZJ141]|uniref:DUF3846 domain-containing protein n=1 Tax=Adlercreutzia sp. ZJ141 TaxID=2709406 RepID=UPI0013EBE281|nr:DUF3846 domain-containing protein [Adlercreutzia sp. ZJ141]